LHLWDTPGFEMSQEILETLRQGDDHFGLDDVIGRAAQDGKEYQRDLRAWEQIKKSQVLLYVIDVFERPKARYKSDLSLLMHAERPVIPVYNFLPKQEAGQPEHHRDEWDELFRRHNMHLGSVYDAHERNQEHERRLLERVKVHLRDPVQEKALQLIIDTKESRERARLESAAERLANLLLDCAAYRETQRDVQKKKQKAAQAEIQDTLVNKIRDREHEAQKEILGVWEFGEDQLDKAGASGDSQVDAVRDWFGKDVLKHFGRSGATGAGVGTAVGFVVDVVTGGTLIGLPTFIGTAVGTALGASYAGVLEYQYDEKNWTVSACVDRAVLKILLCRNLDFILRVQRHGKGKEGEITVASKPSILQDEETWDILRTHRGHAQFSSMNASLNDLGTGVKRKRHAVIDELVETLAAMLEAEANAESSDAP
ncbi:MAG: DUF3482 domain-containing protein, partial [Planctomycetales bacterium]